MKFPWEEETTAEIPCMTHSDVTAGMTSVATVTVPVEDTVALLQKDFAYAVQCTAVTVHSNRPNFEMLVNTPRGQIIPRNECRFTDGTTVEFQDIGMPQPGAPFMSVKELIARVWDLARELGLEFQP